MNPWFTGRGEETELMMEALRSNKSEMVALIGRRRIGKTHLVKQVYGKHFSFEMIGAHHASTAQQLENFAIKLQEHGRKGAPLLVPKSWYDAFQLLKAHLQKHRRATKPVVFIDELPWLSTTRSGFVDALSYFWNDWGVHNKILLVVCGSAATWMIQHVVRNKGGLHNRITMQIKLQPFTLNETEQFLQKLGVNFERYDIARLYFATGGVPYYLSAVKKGQSVAQNIDRICFAENGLLRDEFEQLFASLFDEASGHAAIVQALASKWKGLTRPELVKSLGQADGGSISRMLTELEQSDFITVVMPFGKLKKDALYRITDNFLLFHLKFIKGKRKLGKGSFQALEQTPIWKSWCGYAFENTCIYHLPQIKRVLGISGIYTQTSGFLLPGSAEAEGMQIDWLIERADKVINLCEMKFHDDYFSISKHYAAQLRQLRSRFKASTGTKANLQLVFISSFGLVQNTYSLELIEQQIDLNALFKP